jgi:hypothetical protein
MKMLRLLTGLLLGAVMAASCGSSTPAASPGFTDNPYETCVNPLRAGVMRTAGIRACGAHGEDWEFCSAIVQAKAAATSSVAQGGSEPS